MEGTYPELKGKVHGENFPPPVVYQLIAQLAGIIQMVGFVFVIFGSAIFNLLGVPTPQWYYGTVTNNKMQFIMGLFLLSSVAQQLIATGAFEISLVNGEEIFSKIKTGRMPTIEEIEDALRHNGLE